MGSIPGFPSHSTSITAPSPALLAQQLAYPERTPWCITSTSSGVLSIYDDAY